MIKQKAGLIALLAGLTTGSVLAGDFTTSPLNPTDVIIGFRQNSCLVVDAGDVSTLTSLSPNTRVSIPGYTGSLIGQAVGATNNMSWSAFAYNASDVVYLTRPRATAYLNTQTTPWTALPSAAGQQNIANVIANVASGAASCYSVGYSASSTTTAVFEPYSANGNQSDFLNGFSYADSASQSQGFPNVFGSIENKTPSNFTSAGKVARSDFYKLTPGAGAGTWLGYFELNTNGAVSYVAYPSTTPVIKSISNANGTNTITYTAGVYGTYTLRGTNNLAAGSLSSPTTWPAIKTVTSGDAATHSVAVPVSGNSLFYTITAQ